MREVIVLGGGPGSWGGRGGKSILLTLAMQELGRVEMADMLRRQPDVIVIDECQHLPRIDQMAKEEYESPHPGERHREAVKRVNSGRSRAGKAARWS